MLGDSAAETAPRYDDIVSIHPNRVSAIDYEFSIRSIQTERIERVAIEKRINRFNGKIGMTE